MQVYYVEKNIMEQSSIVPNSLYIIYKEYLDHTLGLAISTPGLVNFKFYFAQIVF